MVGPPLRLDWQPAAGSEANGLGRRAYRGRAGREGDVDQATLAACDRVWQQLRGDAFQYNH